MNRTALKIRIFGEPVLRRKTKPVKQATPEHRDILNAMAQLMYAESGIGLAASQVGINESMAVVDIGTGLYKLINPRVARREGHQVIEEGCLSVPGVCIKVRRSRKVIVKAEDEDFKPITIEAEGLLACAFQHEIDHLNGKLIIDYVPLVEKLKIASKLKKLKKRSEYERLSESETKPGKLQL
ncbi:MAG: peptide deformylase [Candidatus Omnitrophota bacterium]